jgi:PTH1 family peptidyl-tRNA hydrolase
VGCKLIVGLGNPGRRYAGTPHNVGFMALDVAAGMLGCRMGRSWRFHGRVASAEWEGVSVLLLRPETYMNLSGKSVAALARFRKLAASDIVVISDDADMDLGKLRLRARGGSGGHRGLASLIGALGDDGFARVRIGIGRRPETGGLVDHVLTPFGPAEMEAAVPAVRRAAEAALYVATNGIDAAMNRYNGSA